MSALVYGREALRRLREEQARPALEPVSTLSVLDQAPPDAPMDDATLTFWNGERFIAYERWLANQPLVTEEQRESSVPLIPTDATCVVGDCGRTRVWLVKKGQHWTIFANSCGGGRRRGFNSPTMESVIRAAEQRYGSPDAGWRVEARRDAKGATTNETADLSSQDSADQEGTCQGHDDLDLDGR